MKNSKFDKLFNMIMQQYDNLGKDTYETNQVNKKIIFIATAFLADPNNNQNEIVASGKTVDECMKQICKKLNISENWYDACDVYDISKQPNMPYSDDVVCSIVDEDPDFHQCYDILIKKQVTDLQTGITQSYNICQAEFKPISTNTINLTNNSNLLKNKINTRKNSLSDDFSFELFRTIMCHLENYKFFQDARWPCQCVDISYEKGNPYTDLETMKQWDYLNERSAEKGEEGNEFSSPMSALYSFANSGYVTRTGNNYIINLTNVMQNFGLDINNKFINQLKNAMKFYKAPANYNVKFIY